MRENQRNVLREAMSSHTVAVDMATNYAYKRDVNES